ncbi:MAG: signal peptide peptidase SppA [Myxococcales bacterium]|nr:signal peptide peptidase SppA [Myxococcales bacterium]
MRSSTILALATILAACQPPSSQAKGAAKEEAEDKDDKQGEDGDKKDESASSPFGGMGGLGQLGPLGAMMANKLEEPGPYDALKSSPGFKKDQPHWLTLELSGTVSEMKEISISLTGSPEPTLELQPFMKRLDKAAAEPNVQGLLLTFDGLGLDWSAAAELNAALRRFKGDGQRSIACHFDTAVNPTYHLATACDRIGVSPHGMITISGAAAQPVHLKGLLDRLGVVADFIHIGAFKGAAEPLTRTAPSKEMEETLGAILDQFYATQKRGLMEGRKVSEERAAELIDQALFGAEEAKAAGLIDDVAVYEDFRADALGGGEWTKLKLSETSEAFDMSKLQVFLGLAPPKTPKVPHVALVYALGNIIDGDGQGILGARAEIAGHTLSTAIRRMADDDNVAAIVLRVNSGGGSAIASEQITQAILEAKKRKPVIATMGRVAASGGYYISSNATKIYALPDTLTGSIGVIGGKITVEKALGKLGINTYHYGRGERSAMWSMTTPWTAGERESMRAWMTKAYDLFLERCAQGRGMTTEAVHEVAQGRVWTGTDAKARGLVDELGGLEEALAEARALAKVGDDVALEVYPPEPTLKDIVKSIGPMSAPFGVQAALAEIEATAGTKTAQAVAQTLEGIFSLRQQQVQARLFFPVVFD